MRLLSHDTRSVLVHSTEERLSNFLVQHGWLWPRIMVLRAVSLRKLPPAQSYKLGVLIGIDGYKATICVSIDAPTPHVADEFAIGGLIWAKVLPELLIERMKEDICHGRYICLRGTANDNRRHVWRMERFEQNGREAATYVNSCPRDMQAVIVSVEYTALCVGARQHAQRWQDLQNHQFKLGHGLWRFGRDKLWADDSMEAYLSEDLLLLEIGNKKLVFA